MLCCITRSSIWRKAADARYNGNLRHVFSRRVPLAPRILLIESGSRSVLEKLLPVLSSTFGNVEVDVVTCFEGQPKGVTGTIFNIHEYGGPSGRNRLFADLAQRDYQLAGLLSTGDSIMTKWKWWLAYKLPAKFLIVNENSDFFFCDWGNFRQIQGLMLNRAGLADASVLPTLGRLAVLPLSVAFLATYAAIVHLRRGLRLL